MLNQNAELEPEQSSLLNENVHPQRRTGGGGQLSMLKQYSVEFCDTAFLRYLSMIMDLLLFVIAKWASLLVDINSPEVALNLAFLSIIFLD